jgi:hypothetical protein
MYNMSQNQTNEILNSYNLNPCSAYYGYDSGFYQNYNISPSVSYNYNQYNSFNQLNEPTSPMYNSSSNDECSSFYPSYNLPSSTPICNNYNQYYGTQQQQQQVSEVSSNNYSPAQLSPPKQQERKTVSNKRPGVHHHALPEEAVDILDNWFQQHINHPYPSTDEKHELSKDCGITVKQVNSWFCNRRNRSQNTKPKRVKRQLQNEISNVFNELVANSDRTQAIEKLYTLLL